MLTTKLLSQGYQKTKLVVTLKMFYGRHHGPVNPYNAAVSRVVSDVFANDEPYVDFQSPGHTLISTFPSLRPVGMVVKLTYQVMLTIRRRLITPFVLGSMSVGLNILICHTFTDL